MSKKVKIKLDLDNEVIDWLNSQKGSFDSNVNAVLRAYIQAAKK